MLFISEFCNDSCLPALILIKLLIIKFFGNGVFIGGPPAIISRIACYFKGTLVM
jgi:hypothetical protein